MKRIAHAILFIAGFICILFALNMILVPKWNNPKSIENIGMSIHEFEDLSINPDVFFLGSSHMFDGVSPMRIYENYGVVTYNMATTAQPIEVTYYFVKELFRKGYRPKLIIIDANSLYTTQQEVKYRVITDLTPININKLDLIRNYYLSHSTAEMNIDDNITEMLSFIAPLIRYHMRWDELGLDDFKKVGPEMYFTQGQVVHSTINASSVDIDTVNYFANLINENNKRAIWQKQDGCNDVTAYLSDEEYYVTEALELNKEYICSIKQLCELYSCQLMLVKIPVMITPGDYTSSWSLFRHNSVNSFAQENQIPFVDMTFDENLVINWNTDTPDGGGHLNLLGAEKVSDFIGEYIVENYGLERFQCDAYDKKLILFKKYTDVAHIELDTILTDYLEDIGDMSSHLMIVMSACNDMSMGLQDEEVMALRKLGLQTDFDLLEYNYSFISIIDKGEVRYEGISNKKQFCNTSIDDNEISIESAGYLEGYTGSIKINGTEYSLNHRGINFVIYDKDSGLVLDRAYCDTFLPDHEVVHNVGKSLYEYQEYLLGRK